MCKLFEVNQQQKPNMYIKTKFLFLIMMTITSNAKVICPQGLQAYSLAMTPTNIISSKAVPTNTSSPVTFFTGLFNILRLKNLGNAVEAYPNPIIDLTSVTGGVLCQNLYKLDRLRFLINPNGRSPSGNTIDGKGTPLEIEIVYYNLKYGTFGNAKNYPNGLLIVTLQILIGPIPNFLFYPLQYLLSRGIIEKPGSEKILPSPVVYLWFDVFPFVTEYYAFPGSFLDISNNKSYPANHIIPTKAIAFISYNQFNAFKNILGDNGKPISTAQPIYPLASRAVSAGKRFRQIMLPF